MTNHPNRGRGAKLAKALENPELYAATHYAMSLGAGTVFNWRAQKHRADLDRQSIIWSLEDALSEPRPTEWETEIGLMVIRKDLKNLTETCKKLQADHPSECPACRNTSRTTFLARKKIYTCYTCRNEWPKF